MYFLASGLETSDGRPLHGISEYNRLGDINIPGIYSEDYKMIMLFCL